MAAKEWDQAHRSRNKCPKPKLKVLVQTIYSIPVLAHSRKGYQNLCRLITLMKMRVPKHAKLQVCRRLKSWHMLMVWLFDW